MLTFILNIYTQTELTALFRIAKYQSRITRCREKHDAENKNGEELLQRALTEKPDLIITDIMMPKMDGLEAVKQLRSRLETAVIPIIMLTAKKDKESELEGLEAGADDYITKPFDHEKLLARIKMVLRRKT